MKVLITGSAGFIGSHLAEALVDDHQIIGLDNFSDFYDPAIKHQNIRSILSKNSYIQIEADIRDRAKLAEIFSQYHFDLVIHLAAMAGVRPSIINTQLYTEVNINGTVNLLEECRKHNIKKFIFASSSSVYGNNQKVPFAESDPVDNPISPYAASKKAGELICHTYHHLYEISILCLRFFTVYGPRQRPDLAIHKFARLMLQGKPIPVFGDGSTRRDYSYIDDIIAGVLKSIDYLKSNQIYDIFNLGENRTISLNQMIESLEKSLQIKAEKEYLPLQPGDMHQTYADITKSKKILGYDPQTDFETGVEKFIKWLKKE
jgi:UDP-glucuronate 4-epimerase